MMDIQALLRDAAGSPETSFTSDDIARRVLRKRRRHRWTAIAAALVLLVLGVVTYGWTRPAPAPVDVVTSPGPQAGTPDLVGTWDLFGGGRLGQEPGDDQPVSVVFDQDGSLATTTCFGTTHGTWSRTASSVRIALTAPEANDLCPGTTTGHLSANVLRRLAEPLTVIPFQGSPDDMLALRGASGVIIFRRRGALSEPPIAAGFRGPAVTGETVEVDVGGLVGNRGQTVDVFIRTTERHSGGLYDFPLTSFVVDDVGAAIVQLPVPSVLVYLDDQTVVNAGSYTLVFKTADGLPIGTTTIQIVRAKPGQAYPALLAPAQCGNPRFVLFDLRWWLPDHADAFAHSPSENGVTRGTFTLLSSTAGRFTASDGATSTFHLAPTGFAC